MTVIHYRICRKSESAYGNTYGQVFSGMEHEGDCFSVDDYCGFFMLYYNAVYNPVVLG